MISLKLYHACTTNNIVIYYNSGHVVGEHTYVNTGDHNAPTKVSIARLQVSSSYA